MPVQTVRSLCLFDRLRLVGFPATCSCLVCNDLESFSQIEQFEQLERLERCSPKSNKLTQTDDRDRG
jgi:hypothetical protein